MLFCVCVCFPGVGLLFFSYEVVHLKSHGGLKLLCFFLLFSMDMWIGQCGVT